ncbi:hypothetical protein Pcinc_023308 [Petrolisthes cinctipes]|uniref:Uncharacterized protein n=1 Tax=Petrolisthes cinctipes TaxID=88211 RepID=A0AAE1KFY2_PETCI|nr:hypothetical protein Pcinc_023308 [Petrolisthes cinctipes]
MAVGQGRLVLTEEGLQRTNWSNILTGCADAKARAFTEQLKSLQHQHVPHRPEHVETHRSALVWVSMSPCSREEVLCVAALQEERNPLQQDYPSQGM